MWPSVQTTHHLAKLADNPPCAQACEQPTVWPSLQTSVQTTEHVAKLEVQDTVTLLSSPVVSLHGGQ